jgi:(p)ppGpp synthase/HD superfamily hydrolase
MPLAVRAHCLNDSRKHRTDTALADRLPRRPLTVETTPRNAAATALELATAQAAFAELGLEAALGSRGLEVAQLVAQIAEDPALAVAAWLAEARAGGFDCDAQTASACLGAAAERYAQQLAQLGEFSLPADWDASRGLDRQQAETLRKMLLAIAADPKLVVARLGLELVRLRHARELGAAAMPWYSAGRRWRKARSSSSHLSVQMPRRLASGA